VITDETVSIKMSPTQVALGQQTKVTVTVVDAGLVTAPPAMVSIGSRIPSDTFDSGPKGCVFELGGANCPTVSLRPGQQTSLVFLITPGWMPGGSGFDLIFGELNAVDSHGQLYQLGGFQEQVWVDDGTASQAPPSPSDSSDASPPQVSAPPGSAPPPVASAASTSALG
jgi:hypothetical protein